MNPVEIRSRVEAELAVWRATAELATALPRGSWTLVGAQMVFLIAYEHDLPIGRTSGDIDLMMDIRALATRLNRRRRRSKISGTSLIHRRLTAERIASGAATTLSTSSPPMARGHARLS